MVLMRWARASLWLRSALISSRPPLREALVGALKFPHCGLAFLPSPGSHAREEWTVALKLTEATLSLGLNPACCPVLKPNMANLEE